MASRIFRIEENSHYASSHNPRVIGCRRTANVGGVRCHVCGNTWALSGAIFPDREPVSLGAKWEPGVITLERFAAVRSCVAKEIQVPVHWISPGASFGPLVTKLNTNEIPPVLWFQPWCVLVDESVMRRIESVTDRLAVRFANAIVTLRNNRTVAMYEIVASFDISISVVYRRPMLDCVACHRIGTQFPRGGPVRVVLPPSVVFTGVGRMPESPGYLFSTEAIADVILGANVDAARVTPVEVCDEAPHR